MTTTTKEITAQQRITLLKHLANGKDLDTVAAILKMPRDLVFDIARHHGYPDTEKLSWAVDVLTKKAEDDEKATIPTGTAIPTGPTTSISTTSITPTPSPTSLTKPDEIRILLNTAKAHPSKRIQAAADKVFDSIDRLRTLIREDEEKHAARRQQDAEKAAARAEVQRLERQLAEAKAKLRGAPKPAHEGGTTRPAPTGMVGASDLDALGTTSREIRAWARENSVECPDVGRLPTRVLDAWKAAHPEAGAA